jgi:glycosyltransferase involved in cell wall biosynthesis
MASGVPVVASPVPAATELGSAAFAPVEPLSEASIAEAVARVDGDAALHAALRERGLAASRGLDWERAAARTLAVYEAVAARAARGEASPRRFMRDSIQRATSGR